MNYEMKNFVVLTGAGFTRNFGGFLGKDITAMVFNSPQIQEKENLRKLIIRYPDYETAYFEVFNGDKYSEDEKLAFQVAVENAYHLLDDTIKNWVFDGKNEPNTYLLFSKLFGLLIGASNERGMFFTLNQDLFLERQCGYRAPGAPRFPDTFYGRGGGNLEINDFVVLNNDSDAVSIVENEIESHAGAAYIKLHGSYGWLSADGTHRMIIGKNKLEDIESVPLLKCYFEIFRRTLLRKNVRILIIGYGFQDEHINEVLLEAVEEHETEIFVINPTDLSSFVKALTDSPSPSGNLLKGLHGYYPNILKDIFPPNQNTTPLFENLLKSLT